MTLKEFERFHAINKEVADFLKQDKQDQFRDEVVICHDYNDYKVHIHTGIEAIADYYGSPISTVFTLTDNYPYTKYVSIDGVTYFQLCENENEVKK